MLTRVFRAGVMIAGSALLAGCEGPRPASVGAGEGRLAPCPARPNCVSSQAADDLHRVAPFSFAGPAAAAISRLTQIVRALPRTAVVGATETYLHVEFRSAVFGFVDDVEFLADESAGVIHVRSASRLGSSDLGVNRRRVETIRARWGESPLPHPKSRDAGVIREVPPLQLTPDGPTHSLSNAAGAEVDVEIWPVQMNRGRAGSCSPCSRRSAITRRASARALALASPSEFP